MKPTLIRLPSALLVKDAALSEAFTEAPHGSVLTLPEEAPVHNCLQMEAHRVTWWANWLTGDRAKICVGSALIRETATCDFRDDCGHPRALAFVQYRCTEGQQAMAHIPEMLGEGKFGERLSTALEFSSPIVDARLGDEPDTVEVTATFRMRENTFTVQASIDSDWFNQQEADYAPFGVHRDHQGMVTAILEGNAAYLPLKAHSERVTTVQGQRSYTREVSSDLGDLYVMVRISRHHLRLAFDAALRLASRDPRNQSGVRVIETTNAYSTIREFGAVAITDLEQPQPF